MNTQEKEIRQLSLLFTSAYRTYAPGLNTFASLRVHSQELGEDLVQDAFIKTWAYLVKNGKIEIMKGFLYHVLKDLIVDEYRKHKTTSLDVMIENGFDPTIGDPARLMNVFDGRNAALLIKDLPRKYQKVIRMRYVQELSLEEIALLTGQSKNTTTVQAHRGLAKLKVLYNERHIKNSPHYS